MKTMIIRASTALAIGLCLLTLQVATAFAQSAKPDAPANGNFDIFRGNAGHSGYFATNLTAGLAVLWQNTTSALPGNTSSPTLVDGVLYFGSGNHVFAINAKDGTVKWQYPTADVDKSGQALPGPFNCPATVSDGKVYIGGDDRKLYVLDAQTGDNLWVFQTGGAVRSAPLIDSGVVFFGATDNHLYAVRLDNQQPYWGGQFKTNGSVTAAPMVASGYLYFADDESIYRVNEESGRMDWSSRQIGGMTASPVLDNGTVYVGVGRTEEAIVARNGGSRWVATLSSEPSGPATTGGSEGLVYVPTSDQYMYALDSRGGVRWKTNLHDNVVAPPLLTDSLLIAATNSGTVYGMDPHTGAIEWSYTMRPVKATSDDASAPKTTTITAAPIAADGTLYILSDDGTLTAFASGAPDTVPPSIVSTYPSASTAISGVNIGYQITVRDVGSGVRPDSVSLLVDGNPIPVEYDPVQDLVQVKAQTGNNAILGRAQVTLPTLGGGQHSAVLTISDWRGNKLVKNWAFMVDSSLNPAEASLSSPGTVTSGSGNGGGNGQDNNNMNFGGNGQGGSPGVPGGFGGGPGGGGPNGGGGQGGHQPNFPPPSRPPNNGGGPGLPPPPPI
jgi:outer membrane protein assembly factor BamB